MQEKKWISLVVSEHFSCWPIGIKISTFLLSFGKKGGSYYLIEQVPAFKSSAQKLCPSCTELGIQNLEKSNVLPILHFLQGASMYSVLTFVDPMFRLQFNVNIFWVVMPVKKKKAIFAYFQLVILLHFTHSFCSPLQLCLCNSLYERVNG